MNSDKRRLLEAIAESIGRMASRYNIPGSDMDHMAATTVVGELLRYEDSAHVKDIYTAGYALGLRLVELVRRDQASATEITQFDRLPHAIEGSNDYASSQGLLLALKGSLSLLVAKSGYPANPTGDLENIVFALCVWEGELLKLPTPREKKAEQRDVKQMLQNSARAQGGAFGNAQVVEFTSLIGGFSNETILFKLADEKGEIWDLVARASTGLPLGIEGRHIDGEYHLLRYLHRAGVAVAEPIWLERDVEKHGSQFLVTRKLAGRNFGTVVEAQRLTSAQTRALATQLAKIHALALDEAHPDLRQSLIDTQLVSASTSQAVSDYLDRWIRLWRSTGLDSPTVEATLHWLRANLPQIEDAPVLVHGDYALHNIMMHGDELGGVLDWEMSHLGDRAEDIAGLLASFSDQDDAVEFKRRYVEAGGKLPTEFRLEYCNVFRYFIMYVVMLESQLRFYTVPSTHPELLVLASFVQLPAQRMAQAIKDAEKARVRG